MSKIYRYLCYFFLAILFIAPMINPSIYELFIINNLKDYITIVSAFVVASFLFNLLEAIEDNDEDEEDEDDQK